MLPLLLLLPLLWGGSLQEYPGYKLQIPELVTVQEGLCVIVFCEFFYPWHVSFTTDQLCIYWYWTGDNTYSNRLVATNCQNLVVKTETQGRFHLLGDPKTNNCSLSIRDARKSDTGIYEFRVWGQYVQYSYRTQLNLQVTDLTEKADIHILEPLQSGSPTNLTCSLPGSCDGGRPLTFSWMGDALNMLDPSTLQSSVLTLTPRPQDHGTYLTCQVKRRWPQVTTERTIRLNVSYAPQNLTIKIFFQNGTVLKVMGNTISVPILEGQSLRLVCVADSNPPVELSWFQGSQALNVSPIFNTSDLELPPVRIGNEGEFTCRAQNLLGSQNVSLSLSVLYPPQMLGSSCSWEAEGVHCSCFAQAWPAPFLHWWIGDRLVEGNSSDASFSVTSSSIGPWTKSSLSLSMELTSVLRLCCEAWNDHGNQSVTVLLLPGKSASRAEVALGALGGAGTMALLSLCLCLTFFFIVKARRKQAAERPGGMDDEDPVMGTVTWSCRQKPWPESTPAQQSHSGDTPPSREEQDVHYASLSFHGMKPQKSKDEEATSTTEYTEIKTSK
ncbi:sialic acid-binding Ig-like lectin 5 isoform X1 [Trichechus manatus latirostris]|uniref:Sialic acid-binding Ig-like lectin 5 isoform X1 n=1 Tax=Trichechus manatus latirostris TaxID=127582 RepID=A0A2Y9RFG3_TRIMA|nr:sialic acid-binding Ig-like lectin 5 isoform X1 [Trichechus manatus latirostris]